MKINDKASSTCCGKIMTFHTLVQCLKCGFIQKHEYDSCHHMHETTDSKDSACNGFAQRFTMDDGDDHIHIGYWKCETCGRIIKTGPIKYCIKCSETFSPNSKRKIHRCRIIGVSGQGKIGMSF